MRKHKKEQLIDILDSLCELHSELSGKNTSDIIDNLQDCQQVAIVVGETLEQSALKRKEEEISGFDNLERHNLGINQAVSLLEQYCEELFFISQEEIVSNERVGRLSSFISQVADIIENLMPTYQVVFFPYKAEMWDSLESIWRACREDECCDAVVVPIPYYRYDAKRKETITCYDGDKFPEDIPVVSYMEFSLQSEMPDAAYIHNPYDDHNLVTSVHPAFYSSELKKYVKKLVYVPYYVTTGGISPEHLLLPAYLHMDYMVVQSQFFKDGCKEMFYYNRVLPLGSPKLDKVIRLCCQGKEKLMPAEWKSFLEGKKTLMLNTSLNCFLQQGEQYLQKIYTLFQWVKENSEIAIVWRPHPLLEATINSMRPHLLEKYHILKAYFEGENIGVFDNTPDIERTVAIVDGYIGEEGTSVVNLFGAAGKPLFILNNFIYNEKEENWNRKIRISDMIYEEGKWYLISFSYNGLFSINSMSKEADSIDWSQIEFEGRVEGQPRWYCSNLFLMKEDNKLYLSPGMAFQTGRYDFETGEFFVLSSPAEFTEEKKFMQCREMISYGDKIFFLPNKNGAVWEYCVVTKRWTEHKECVDELRKGLSENVYASASDISGYVREGNLLYMVTSYTNRVLCYDMDSGKHRIYEVGDSGYTYSAIAGSEGIFWLAETVSGKLVKWDKNSNQIQEIAMPKEFGCFSRYDASYYVHSRLFEMGSWIITTPAFSNCMIKVDKLTGKVSLCAKELWDNVEQPCNDYHPQFYTISGFAKKIDENTLWIQRTFDDALIELKVDKEEYRIHYPTMNSQALENLLRNEDGFERPNRDYYAFARRESRLFPMEGFMKELVSGHLEDVHERQLQELSDFAAHLDGSCGQKVHEFMMNELRKEV